MSWTTSIADLRSLLSDGPLDRIAKRKRVFGIVDGVNTRFYTFEFRRATDFTTAVDPDGVYVNGAHVAASSDDLTSGMFTLASPPPRTAAGSISTLVEATYYYQWFTDSELSGFLSNAARWLGQGSDPSVLVDGLIPAALQYAAKDGYYKMALKWRERASTAFMLEDAPRKEAIEAATGFEALVASSYKMAKEERNDFYTRQGQSNAPLFGTALGRARQITPRR